MPKRTSPDSVICIDLTEDDDECEKSLNSVRKRLKGTTAADSSTPKVKIEGARANLSNDDGGGGKIGSVASLQQQENLASEVEVIEPAAPEIHAVAPSDTASLAAADNDDVVLVGTANENRLPHMRQHCPDNKFVQDIVAMSRSSHMTATKRRELEEGTKDNVQCCDKCYCFVCDKPASECTSWGTEGQSNYSSHCHASDAGTDAPIWKKKRADVANEATVAPAPPPPTIPATTGTVPPAHLDGRGPFAPDNPVAPRCPDLTQCRKCGWYNRFHHRNFEKLRYDVKTHAQVPDLHPVGVLDWCHRCGRVASERDFGKLQAQPYTRNPGDVYLGEKVIPFTIVAHDPRNFSRYKESWASGEASDPTRWTFSQAEMEEEVFKHRLGQYPLIEMILASLPVVPVEKLPKSGSLKKRNSFAYRAMSGEPTRVSADETDAIVVKNRVHCSLLEELLNFGTIGCMDRDTSKALLDGDIVASWNSAAQTGTFTLRVFLQPAAFTPRDWKPIMHAQPSLTKFLGTWFDIFPFAISDLNTHLHARRPKGEVIPGRLIKLRIPPFSLAARHQRKAMEKVAKPVKRLVKRHNKKTESHLTELSLCSSSKGDLLGGVSVVEAGLGGILKRYYQESFVEDLDRHFNNAGLKPWEACLNIMGTTLTHRSMRLQGAELVPGKSSFERKGRETNFEPYLQSNNELKLAMFGLASDSRNVIRRTGSIKGLLDHVENLHHPSVPFVEGLTVELLEFQRQSVQWALERETTPGGVQSFLWAKLPNVAEPGTDVYYNPIMERFRRDKPQLVRGGLICEEMGLGKTVISLALILQNPAPAVPQSGSAITVLNNAASVVVGGQESWDKDLYARTSASNEKRGSIISRGTLVVCHVSLVGQWIEEAKSKLSNPGLVYPYHGQSRKRNAATLAQNAIVVTTYQTLASDATYHAKKGGRDYCAPCEQVRWWRIICDESHSLRDESTKKSMAVMNLVADHKWLVSGTPINTSLRDLCNQLKFIGLENVDEMFKTFSLTVFEHTNDPGRTQKRGRMTSYDNRVFGHFMFLLRCIMIRHSHAQTYRGTSTTLMSLPPKTERTVEVEFSEDEKKEYEALEKDAVTFYKTFKSSHGHNFGKYYLRLSARLTPLRIAASGGRVPLDGGDEEDSDETPEQQIAIDDEEDSKPKKKRAKKEQRYSEFAYKSKIEALVAALKHARDEDPKAKSLLFSQFSSTLKWLQQELPKHGFQYRTLSGDMSMRNRAKALYDFQNDPPTTVFLLSLRAGAVGINLTQANRVFLMEPSFNPAVEEQAIGRVHRLGQKRKVEVIRLIMKDSVETRLLKMLKKKYGKKGKSNSSKKDNPQEDDAMVGSIQVDKTKVLGDEFDILYGVSSEVKDEDVIIEEVVSASLS